MLLRSVGKRRIRRWAERGEGRDSLCRSRQGPVPGVDVARASRCRNETPWASLKGLSVPFGGVFLLAALTWRPSASRRGCTAPASRGSLPWTSVLPTPTRSSPVREPPRLAGDWVASAKGLQAAREQVPSFFGGGGDRGGAKGREGFSRLVAKLLGTVVPGKAGRTWTWLAADSRLFPAPRFVFQGGLIKTSLSLTRARSRSWRRSRGTPRRLPVSSSTPLRCAQARVRPLPSQPRCPRSGFLGPLLVLCSAGVSASCRLATGRFLPAGSSLRGRG